jgi:predicted transcriptional regulator
MDLRTLYRLIVLYMIGESNDPLSNTQITGFILEKEYTNYFVLQETISNLLDSGLILSESVHGNTLYYLTDEGKQTLSYFEGKISDSIKEDVLDFLENANLYYDEPIATSQYEKTGDNKYDVTCTIRNRKKTLLQIVLSVSTEEQADAICRNWDEQYINTYTGILDLLLN